MLILTRPKCRILVVALALLAPAAALAQTFPAKSVRIIVATSPGGFVDIVTRTLAARLTEGFGQPFLVENRPGSGGQIGVNSVAKAAPDGYTYILASPGSLTVAPHFIKLPYDPLKDLVAIARVATSPSAFAVHVSVPVKSFKEFLEYAKARPGALNFGNPGAGTLLHLAGELMKLMTGINMVAVPYKGTAPVNAAIAAGEVQVGFADLPSMKPLADGGRIRILAVVDPERTAAAPDIPTVAESGLPGYEAGGWGMLLGPTGIPREIIGRMDAEVARALKHPELLQIYFKATIDPAYLGPEDAARYLRNIHEKWGKVIREANLKAGGG